MTLGILNGVAENWCPEYETPMTKIFQTNKKKEIYKGVRKLNDKENPS